MTDVRRLCAEFGAPVSSYVGFCALVQEARLRRPPHFEVAALVDRLQLRDVAVLVLPAGGDVQAAVVEAASDNEARSVLYLLRTSDPCPGCGLRAQRNADAAGCPSVMCPACGTHFRCFSIAGDRPDGPKPAMSVASKYQLYRLLTTWTHAAEELEQDRRALSLVLAQELSGLSDVFARMTDGKLTLDKMELRRAFFSQGMVPTEEELQLLWTRYASVRGSKTVTFPDFRRQLQPRL